jgi:hypothetical protein
MQQKLLNDMRAAAADREDATTQLVATVHELMAVHRQEQSLKNQMERHLRATQTSLSEIDTERDRLTETEQHVHQIATTCSSNLQLLSLCKELDDACSTLLCETNCEYDQQLVENLDQTHLRVTQLHSHVHTALDLRCRSLASEIGNSDTQKHKLQSDLQAAMQAGIFGSARDIQLEIKHRSEREETTGRDLRHAKECIMRLNQESERSFLWMNGVRNLEPEPHSRATGVENLSAEGGIIWVEPLIVHTAIPSDALVPRKDGDDDCWLPAAAVVVSKPVKADHHVKPIPIATI